VVVGVAGGVVRLSAPEHHGAGARSRTTFIREAAYITFVRAAEFLPLSSSGTVNAQASVYAALLPRMRYATVVPSVALPTGHGEGPKSPWRVCAAPFACAPPVAAVRG